MCYADGALSTEKLFLFIINFLLRSIDTWDYETWTIAWTFQSTQSRKIGANQPSLFIRDAIENVRPIAPTKKHNIYSLISSSSIFLAIIFLHMTNFFKVFKSSLFMDPLPFSNDGFGRCL